MLTKTNLSITATTMALLLGIAATALAAEGPVLRDSGDVPVLSGAATKLERAIDGKRARHVYQRTTKDAADLGVEPKKVLGAKAGIGDLKRATNDLRRKITAEEKAIAKREAAMERQREDAVAGLEGTLASIAACESGGNPAAIGGGGLYRGKYQFDMGTWASVGGSGDPAAASEAEQDYRAALLYQRSGSSPWPVCGS